MKILRGNALFCEDIREEKTGQDTLVGIMADNILLRKVPAMVPRLAVYVRFYFHVSDTPEPVSLILGVPGGDRVEVGAPDTEIVRSSIEEANRHGAQLAGIILKGAFSPLKINATGPIEIAIKVGEKEHVLGSLNVIASQTSTASEPPSSQSPSSA